MYTISYETLVGIGLATALAAVTYTLGYAQGDRDKQGDIDGLTASLREAQDRLFSATAAYDEESARLAERLQDLREETQAVVSGAIAERDQAIANLGALSNKAEELSQLGLKEHFRLKEERDQAQKEADNLREANSLLNKALDLRGETLASVEGKLAAVSGAVAERDQALKEANDLRLDVEALNNILSIRNHMIANFQGKLAVAQAKIDSWCSPDNRTSAASSALLEQPYVVIPALAVAVLPLEWRKRLIVLLDEAEDMGVNWPTGYNVIKRGAKGRAVKDAWNIGTGLMVRNGEGPRMAFEAANGGPLKAGAGETPC